MPAFVTHYLFGIDAYKLLPKNKFKNNIKKNHCAFALGLQGPDVFFYYIPSHIMHKGNIGDVAHRKNTQAFFSYLLESRMFFSDNPKKQAIADAYLIGFLGHYTLDSAAHPYVYAFTGYDASNPPKVTEYFGQHAYFETEIDNELLYSKKFLLPSEFHQNATIYLTPLQRSVISKMLSYAYRNTYPELNVHALDVGLATHFMKVGTRLLHDPSGQKKVLLRLVEKVLLNRPLISPMMASDLYQFVPDPLNLAHKKWIHPWTGESSDESFINLYNKAISHYYSRIINYCALVDSGFTAEGQKEFMQEYGNLSFLSGVSCR